MVTNNSGNNPTGASGTVLQGQGVGTASAFSTATYPATTTVSQILYSSATNVVGGITTANNAILATNSSGVPTITAASGNWLNTSRCAFLAYLGTTDTDVTGDGTAFTLGSGNALTEVFDQGSNFVTTGTFTAPVTGVYLLGMNARMGGQLVGNTTIFLSIATTATTYTSATLNPFVTASTVGVWQMSFSQLANMTANDTATFLVTASGGTKVMDVTISNRTTNVWGYLVC